MPPQSMSGSPGADPGRRRPETPDAAGVRPEVAPIGTTAEAALDIENELQGELDYNALKGRPQEDIQGRRTLQKNREIVRGGR